MKTEVRKITPEDAAAYLEGTVTENFRKPSRITVRDYAADMREGRWQLTHQAIGIDKHGNVIDGQHRLLAVVEAGVPVEMSVTTGVEPAIADVVDTNRPRTAAQMLAAHGVVSSGRVNSALRIVHTVDTDPYRKVVINSGTNAVVLDLLKKYPGVADWATTATRIGKATGLAEAGLLAGIYLIDRAQVGLQLDSFLEGLETGADLGAEDSRLVLRNVTIRTTYNDLRPYTIAAFTVKAWNAYVSQTPMKRLLWKRGVEKFPTPLVSR